MRVFALGASRVRTRVLEYSGTRVPWLVRTVVTASIAVHRVSQLVGAGVCLLSTGAIVMGPASAASDVFRVSGILTGKTKRVRRA